eukprot:gene563-708_t
METLSQGIDLFTLPKKITNNNQNNNNQNNQNNLNIDNSNNSIAITNNNPTTSTTTTTTIVNRELTTLANIQQQTSATTTTNVIHYQPGFTNIPLDDDNFDNSTAYKRQLTNIDNLNNNNNYNYNDIDSQTSIDIDPNSTTEGEEGIITEDGENENNNQTQMELQANLIRVSLFSNFTRNNIIWGCFGLSLILSTVIMFIVGFVKQNETIIFSGIITSPIGFLIINHSIHLAYRRSRRQMDLLQQQAENQNNQSADGEPIDTSTIQSKLDELKIDILSSPPPPDTIMMTTTDDPTTITNNTTNTNNTNASNNNNNNYYPTTASPWSKNLNFNNSEINNDNLTSSPIKIV